MFFKKLYIFVLVNGIFLSLIFTQEFGKNKVQYKQFSWQIYKTTHFDIFYYFHSSSLIEKIAKAAEEAYNKVSSDLKHHVSSPVPLILYSSHNEFEQTNIIPGFIGESVGGFTSLFLKKRIAIPISSSFNEFRKVLIHELTHFFFLDILKDTLKSSKTTEALPLWLIEGLAEYVANDWDSYGEMILKEAILNKRVIPFDNLYNFSTINSHDVYLAYKQSHSFVEFIAQKLGKEDFVLFLKTLKNGIQAAMKTTNLNLKDLEILWKESLKEKYIDFVDKIPNINKIATPIIPKNKDIIYSTYPRFSPKGEHIIYVSDKNGFHELFYTDLKFKKPKSLTKNLLKKEIDSLTITEIPFCWAPDGQKIAFIAERKGDNCIFIQEVTTCKLIKKIKLNLDDIKSLSWSSDGKYLAFVGIKENIADIYIYDIKEENLFQLTKDEFEDYSPSWSTDSKMIIYTSERNDNKEIFIFNFLTQETTQLTYNFGNNFYPIFISNNQEIIFTSDKNKAINLFKMNIKTNEISSLSDIAYGVFSPSISRDEKNLIFSYYTDGKMDLYLMDLNPQNKLELAKKEFTFSPPWNEEEKKVLLLKEKEKEEEIFKTICEKKEKINNFTGKEFKRPKQEKNKFRITIDEILPFIYYESLSGIFHVGCLLISSDILGDRYIIFQGENSQVSIGEETKSLSEQLKDINMNISFYSFKHRTNYKIEFFNQNYYFFRYKEENWRKMHQQYSGMNLILSFPFDRYKRLDTAFITEILNRTYLEGDFANESYKRRGIELSFVKDVTSWKYIEPIEGFRGNITLQFFDKILGGNTQFCNVKLDGRQYWSIFKSLIFCTRIKFVRSIGEDKQEFWLGGFDDLRGYSCGEFTGSTFLLSNTELRYPLITREFYLATVLFFDTAVIWTEKEKNSKQEEPSNVGIGLRFVPPFSPVILRFDWAWPLEEKKNSQFYIYWDHMF